MKKHSFAITIIFLSATLTLISAQTRLDNSFNLCANADQNYTAAKGWVNCGESDRFVVRCGGTANNSSLTASQVTTLLNRLESSYDSIVGGFQYSNGHEPSARVPAGTRHDGVSADLQNNRYNVRTSGGRVGTSQTTGTASCKIELIVARSSGSADWADGGGALYGGTVGSGNARRPTQWFAANASTSTAVTHELVHGLQQMAGGFQSNNPNGNIVGWFHESHAEFMTDMFNNVVRSNTEVYTRQGHIGLGYARTRYQNWMFIEYFKDKFGMPFVTKLWTDAVRNNATAQGTADPFGELMRIHSMSQADFGDVIWEFAARNVIFDHGYGSGMTYFGDAAYGRAPTRKSMYRSAYNGQSEVNRYHRFTYLEALDSTANQDALNNRYVSPFAFSPQRYGYNIIRLYPDSPTGAVRVKFRGDVQTANNVTNYTKRLDLEPSLVENNPGSSWRYGLVAVAGDALSTAANVNVRGGPASAGGYSNFQRTVASSQASNPDVEITMQSGEQLYLVVAATPTVNHKIKWDQYHYTIYRFPYMVEITGAKPEGFQAVTNPAGRQHANGGGFVANTATVAATAYVGPNARVTGGTVSGNARIEGRALVRGGTVSGDAIVRDYARVVAGTVTGSAIVSDGAVIWNGRVEGNARVHGSSFVNGTSTVVRDSAQVGGVSWYTGGTLSGTARVLGDGNGTLTASSGVYYAKDNGSSGDQTVGAARTAVPVEFTKARSRVWPGGGSTPAAQTPVAAKTPGRHFKFDSRGNLKYDLGGAPSANMKIFDGKGRLVQTIKLTGAQKTAATNINLAAQMLFWKVEIDGKIADRGKFSMVSRM